MQDSAECHCSMPTFLVWATHSENSLRAPFRGGLWHPALDFLPDAPLPIGEARDLRPPQKEGPPGSPGTTGRQLVQPHSDGGVSCIAVSQTATHDCRRRLMASASASARAYARRSAETWPLASNSSRTSCHLCGASPEITPAPRRSTWRSSSRRAW